MSYRERLRLESRIAWIMDKSEDLPDEVRADLAKYVCVLASAFLEVGCREVFHEYSRRRADPTVTRFVDQQLGRFRNPNMEKILQLAGAFDKDLRRELEAAIDDSIKGAVDSIVAQRHLIAHGRPSDITLVRIKDYHQKSRKLFRVLRTEIE